MKAIRLRTEYLYDPIGIDIRYHRLLWHAEGGMKQTAYQIITESWDSGRVESASMQAVYPRELCSRERVSWRVRLWDENGEEGELSDLQNVTEYTEKIKKKYFKDINIACVHGKMKPAQKEKVMAEKMASSYDISDIKYIEPIVAYLGEKDDEKAV